MATAAAKVLKQLIALGKELGYEGDALQTFVKEEREMLLRERKLQNRKLPKKLPSGKLPRGQKRGQQRGQRKRR